MDLAKNIETILSQPFADAGIDIVCVYIFHLNTGMKVQVLIEKSNGDPVSIDDCVFCNRTASTLLDVENPINTEYTLEVSSPGEYRPLTKIRDFERFNGNLVKVELHSPVDGVKRFKGVIDSVEHVDNDASVSFKEIEGDADRNKKISVMFSNIHKATFKKVFEI